MGFCWLHQSLHFRIAMLIMLKNQSFCWYKLWFGNNQCITWFDKHWIHNVTNKSLGVITNILVVHRTSNNWFFFFYNLAFDNFSFLYVHELCWSAFMRHMKYCHVFIYNFYWKEKMSKMTYMCHKKHFLKNVMFTINIYIYT